MKARRLGMPVSGSWLASRTSVSSTALRCDTSRTSARTDASNQRCGVASQVGPRYCTTEALPGCRVAER